MAALNHMTSYLPAFQAHVTSSVSVNKVHDLTINTNLDMDQSTLSFDLNHNFTSEFHWNMNQLFVYLVASYNTTSNVRNEVTIWDRIITNAEEAQMVARKLAVEYPLRDMKRELRGRKIQLHVRYRTMPITGIMYTKEISTSTFQAPDEYFRDGAR